MQELRAAVDRLPAGQREAVASHLGLDGAPDMAELLAARGVTRQWLCKRKDEGLRELRITLGDKG
jgi:hypothetical protein